MLGEGGKVLAWARALGVMKKGVEWHMDPKNLKEAPKQRPQAEQMTLNLGAEFQAPLPHHCHAIGCQTSVPPRFLMCSKHWSGLAEWAQRLIWAYYRTGQEVSKTPSLHYLMAQGLVISADAYRRGLLDKAGMERQLSAIAERVGEGVALDVFKTAERIKAELEDKP